MVRPKRILLVEDSPKDIELILEALEDHKLVNFQEFLLAVKQLGIYWVLVNEPPPGGGSIRVESG